MNKKDIKSLTIEELTEWVVSVDEKAFRSKQLYQWMHQKKVRQIDEMSNLSHGFREQLKEQSEYVSLKMLTRQEDQEDGTVKYLFQLSDGHVLETVLMSYKYGYSVCISSQVGCKMGCTFCASTIGGLKRQLTPSEMLDQIYYIEHELGEEIHSVVVMGTGEPLDNYDNLIRFIELISDKNGRNLGRRHITVSTCGLVDAMYQLAEDVPQINLAISLHSPTQEMRAAVMPIARKYDLDTLMKACKDYTDKTGRRITFEYSLIKGVNDDEQHARLLVKLLSGLLCHVNLIPVNPVDEREHEASDMNTRHQFMNILEKGRIPVTLRRSLGSNIDAACGQLRNRFEKN